ncbi:hypothetical protein [Paenibacillus sp. XY044]|uniref:hypothetical protein n=1 Tax=Paenibacillus sp. XY044 TaxID=2026089 RepID=UPI00117E1029|nr:hypothetical protein [Paenibacillus sp. XY044]
MNSVPSMVSQQLGLLRSGATPEDVREGQSFVSPGSLAIQTGTMKDNGDLGTIVPGTADIPIPEGYTVGGTVAGDPDLVAANIKSGVDIFGVTGSAILAEGNATNADVLEGKTYSTTLGAGTGTMPNNGSLGTITPGTTNQTIPAGYTSGGTVAGSDKLIASNIKKDVQIFGVTGNVIQATGSATADKLLAGQTASNAAGSITGTMPNNGSLGTITPGTTNQSIPAGYTTGGTVAGSGNLQAGNIRLGVQIFNVTGTLDPGTQTGGTAKPDQVIAGETFTNDNGVQTGNMPDNGAVTITPGATIKPIPKGYHDGNGSVQAVTFDASKVLTGTTIAGTAGMMPNNGALGTITPGTASKNIAAGYTSGGMVAGDANLVAANIKSGVSIFGVTGTLTGGNIKSVQRGVTRFYGAGIISIDVPVSAIDIANTVLKTDVVSDTSSPAQAEVLGEIIDSTTIRFSINSETTTFETSARWELIEFQNLKSLQKGTIAGSGNSTTSVTISIVNTAKTITFMSYKSTNSSSSAVLKRASFVSNSSLTLYTVTGASTINYFVVEFP